MNAVFRLIPIIFKYIVNIGPLVYEATKWGIKVIREIKSGKKPAKAEPVKPEPLQIPVEEFMTKEPFPAAKADLDPG
jgi:hypothetical protein